MAEALEEVFSVASRVPFKPNCAFLFFSDSYLKDFTTQLDKHLAALPPLALLGCTGSSIVGVDAEGVQHEIEGTPSRREAVGLSLALAHVNGDAKVWEAELEVVGEPLDNCFPNYDLRVERESLRVGAKAITALSEDVGDGARRSVRAIVLADTGSEAVYQGIDRFVSAFDEAFPGAEVTGGIASSHRQNQSHVLVRQPGAETKLYRNAIVAMTIASDLAAEGEQPLPVTHASVARNFSPIGPAFTILEIESTREDDPDINPEFDDWVICEMKPLGDKPPPASGREEEEEEEDTPGDLLQKILEGNDDIDLSMGEIAFGFSTEQNALPSQLQIVDEIRINKQGHLCVKKSDLKLPPGKWPLGGTARFMCQGHVRGMEEDVNAQLRWTEAFLQERPGFGNRLSDGGRGETRTAVRGGLMFSCNGRGSRFFGKPNVDSGAFQSAFPSSVGPARGLAGFFCNGEIGPTHLGSTSTKLHGFTSVFTLFEGF